MTAIFSEEEIRAKVSEAGQDPTLAAQVLIDVLKNTQKIVKDAMQDMSEKIRRIEEKGTKHDSAEPKTRSDDEDDGEGGKAADRGGGGRKKKWEERTPLGRLKGIDHLGVYKKERVEFAQFRVTFASTLYVAFHSSSTPFALVHVFSMFCQCFFNLVSTPFT